MDGQFCVLLHVAKNGPLAKANKQKEWHLKGSPRDWM
jgi:hypothetical protein